MRNMVFVGLCIVIVFCIASPVSAACSVVGKWTQSSFSGCINNFYPDGTCDQSIPDNVGSNTGTWVQDGNLVTIYWNFKCCGAPQNFIDYNTLGPDCNTYSGVNQYGDQFTGSRIDQNQPPVAIAGAGGSTPWIFNFIELGHQEKSLSMGTMVLNLVKTDYFLTESGFFKSKCRMQQITSDNNVVSDELVSVSICDLYVSGQGQFPTIPDYSEQAIIRREREAQNLRNAAPPQYNPGSHRI